MMRRHTSQTYELKRLLHEVSFKPRQRMDIFWRLDSAERVTVLSRLTKRVQRDILTQLSEDQVVAMLEQVDPDQATDWLRLLEPKRRQKILERLSEGLKEAAAQLLAFDPATAAGLMNVNYIQADVSDTIGNVAREFRRHEQRTGRLPVILATYNERLVGTLPVHELAFAKSNEPIDPYIKRILTIHQSASHEEVNDLFRSHPHNRVAVLDDKGSVVGIIYSDDVLKLMQEQKGASLYDFAGVNAEENVLDPARRKVKSRYKWLILNLATAFLAAFTVGLFEDTISKYVLLAVYMPIVAGMGGNAATQTLAVLVRGIALRQINLGTAYRTLKSELGAAFVNGLINGFLVAFVVLVKDHDVKIAFILAMAMVINLLVAAVFGTIVPLIMSKLRKDPAASATIFITTATDVLGFLAFLGLAAVILS